MPAAEPITVRACLKVAKAMFLLARCAPPGRERDYYLHSAEYYLVEAAHTFTRQSLERELRPARTQLV